MLYTVQLASDISLVATKLQQPVSRWYINIEKNRHLIFVASTYISRADICLKCAKFVFQQNKVFLYITFLPLSLPLVFTLPTLPTRGSGEWGPCISDSKRRVDLCLKEIAHLRKL